jgi:hypothetical protein
MPQNLRILQLLVRMRYKLLWAQARTGPGKAAMFFAIYLVGLIVFALVTLGFFGTGVATAQSGRVVILTQGMLGSFFVSGLTVSLLVGVGPSAAFADNVLRRYPLSNRWRFAAQHLIGVLDPVWLLIGGSLLGLAVGFRWMRVCPLLVSLPVFAVFLAATYLCAAIVALIVRKLLQYRTAGLILTVVGVLAILVVVLLATTAVTSENVGQIWPLANVLIASTPARAAAWVVGGPSLLSRVAAATILLSWVLAGAIGLRIAERFELAMPAASAEMPEGEDYYEALALLFPARLRPLVAKSLRYHLRCNRVRYSLVMTAPILLFISLIGNQPGSDKGTLLLAFMFVAGFFATMVMAVNYFGWDAAGMRRYPLLPIPLPEVLKAHSYSSMLLGLVDAIGTMIVGIVVLRLHLSARAYLFLAFDILAGLFFLHAVALWIVVWAPKRADFSLMMGNVVSLPAKLLMIASIMPLIFINTGWGPSVDVVVGYWRWAAAGMLIAVLAYWLSLKLTGHLLVERREILIEKLAGAASN